MVDSAGALILDDASDRVSALVAELGSDAQVGFHGHQNMSFGVANSVYAVRAGAKQIDGTLMALGAGAGNSLPGFWRPHSTVWKSRLVSISRASWLLLKM